MEPNDRPKTQAALYREHVLKAETFCGSSREYCVQHGLNAGLFYSHKSEMGLSKPKRRKFAVIKTESEAPVESKFVRRVDILPDPKWVAEFLSRFVALQ